MEKQGAIGPDGGLPAPKIPADYKPGPFQQWMAQFCYDMALEGLDDSWAILVENDFLAEFEDFTLTGHIDVLAVKLGPVEDEFEPQVVEAILTDHKAGAIAVNPAPENEQIMGYAVHVIHAYPYLQKLTCRIVQPRNDEEQGDQRVSQMVMEGVSAFRKATDFTLGCIRRALGNPLRVETGDRQCRYCPAAMQCPALKLEIDQLMQLDLTKEQIEAVQPETPMDTLINLFDAAKKFGPVLDAGVDTLKARIVSAGGNAIFPDGRVATVKPRGGKRHVTDNAAGLAVLGELPERLRLSCIEIKPGECERAYAEFNVCPLAGAKPVTGKKIFEQRFAGIVTQDTHQILTVSRT
jgi:hypothetical protein